MRTKTDSISQDLFKIIINHYIMSNEKVQRFLEEERILQQQRKNEELAELKYKVLEHYQLGKKIYYKEGDNIDDFPLDEVNENFEDVYFRYDCDISDDDFQEICKIYEEENSKSPKQTTINNRAENILYVCSLISLIVGIIALIASVAIAIDEEIWLAFGIGILVFLTSLIEYAFVKVFVNISYKLDWLKK